MQFIFEIFNFKILFAGFKKDNKNAFEVHSCCLFIIFD